MKRIGVFLFTLLFALCVNAQRDSTLLLPEVEVKASRIYSHNDTINYNVTSYLNPNDMTLADVLKKMPGINVTDGGKISYMGKDISKLKIEGLDLMKSHYGIATNSLNPSDIATVQVIENDQDIKALKGLQPEDRASINLKLKKGVIGIFNLIATLGVGGEGNTETEHAKTLYDNNLLATYFRRNSQLLANYEGNNTGWDLSQELHTQSNSARSQTPQLTGIEPLITDLLDKDKYYFNNSHTATYNQVFRPHKDMEVGLNTAFWTDRSQSQSNKEQAHLLPNGLENFVIESQHYTNHSNMVYGDLSYIINKAHNYQKDLLSFNYNRQHVFGSVDNEGVIGQSSNLEDYRINNDFYFVRRNSQYHGIEIRSKFNIEKSPQRLDVDSNLFSQTINGSEMFQTVHRRNVSVSGQLRWLSAFVIGKLRFHPDVCFEYSENGLKSSLSSFANNIHLGQAAAKAGIDGSMDLRKLKMYFYLPLQYHYSTFGAQDSHDLQFVPNAELVYKANAANELDVKFSTNYNQPTVDQLYTNYVLRSYRVLSAYRDICLYQSNNQNYRLEWKNKNILSMRFLGIVLNYIHDKPKVLYGSSYSGNAEWITSISTKETADLLSVSCHFSQGLTWANSKIELNTTFNHSDQPLLLQEETERYIANTWSAKAYLYTAPLSFLSFSWHGDVSRVWSKMKGGESIPMIRQVVNKWELDLRLSHNINIQSEFSHYYNNVNVADKSFLLANMKADWVLKGVRFTLYCNNVFNQQTYGYSSSENLTTTRLQFPLRGRSIVLKARFKIL